MALTLHDVEKIAKLSRLSLTEAEKAQNLQQLNDVFALVEKMQSVDTEGVEPNIRLWRPKCATVFILFLK